MNRQMTLDYLSEEHGCLMTIAEEIELRLDELHEEGHTDYAALLERVEFMREHFVNAHLPKDQAVVDQLLKDSGREAQRVISTTLNTDGIAFLEHTEAFESDLKRVLCEQLVSRDALMRHGHATVCSLRAQIAMEESAILPWARHRLDLTAWENINRAVKGIAHRGRGNGCVGTE